MSDAHASAPAAAYALLHALWQGAVIAALAAWMLRAMARRSAAARHAVAMAGLAAMAAAMIATFVLYRAPGASSTVATQMPGPVLVRGAGWVAIAVPLVWMIGALASALHQLVGWRAVLRAGAARAAPGEWVLRIDRLRRQLGIRRRVAVRWQAGGAPWTARARRPIVWLPAAWGALPSLQRDALALHELAHVRRLDWIWNGAQRALEGALWFHPAARWLGARARQEREHACDDCAVAHGGERIALAEALVAVERDAMRPRMQLALAARGGELLQRIARLLGAERPRHRATRPALAMIAASLVGAALATRIALPHDVLLGLRVDASTTGPLTPGSYREIDADALRSRYHYRATVDATGRLHELYEQDGAPRAIDGAVRAWLDELVAIDAR